MKINTKIFWIYILKFRRLYLKSEVLLQNFKKLHRKITSRVDWD